MKMHLLNDYTQAHTCQVQPTPPLHTSPHTSPHPPHHDLHLHRNPPLQLPPRPNLTLQTPPAIPPHERLQRPDPIERQLPPNDRATLPTHRLRRDRHKHHNDLAVLLAREDARLDAGAVDGFVGGVGGPEPADDFVAGVEGGLLALEAGVGGGDFVEEEVVRGGAGEGVRPGGLGPGCRVAMERVSLLDACRVWNGVVVLKDGTYDVVVVRFKVSRAADAGGEWWVSSARLGELL